MSCNASTSQGAYFPGPSFTCPGTTLSGGADPYSSGLAHPYVTLYNYDGLGNLLCVEQHGDAGSGTGCGAPPGSDASSPWRVRRFTYDSLSRLLTAKNPESGTISYSYDADGNLLQKTSPQANQTGSATTTISYCYDALNRVIGRAYSAQSCPLSSPVVTYAYDGGTNGIGHLTSLTDQAGSGSYGYDALGRMTVEQRTIAGISKTVSYGYYLDNSVQTLTYPSGAVVTYTPWNNGTNAVAGATQAAADNSNGINYVSLGNYQADGQITAFNSGNSGGFAGITNSFSYNKRLQPINMSAASPSATVFSLNYDFHLGAGDNGNVWGITNNKDTSRNQAFSYDSLNRLTSAQNAGTNCAATTVNGKTEYWGNSYGYDAWGNLLAKTVTKCSAENLSVTAAVSNQLQGGYIYDAAGNMTHDATANLNYSYDQENRITGAAGYTYTYDGDGNRVEKSNGTTGTLYWYMSPGIVAESDLSGNLTAEYVFFDGERVARKDFPGNAVSYYFSDHLKTTDIVTDAQGNIKNESDFYPWGGELQFLANDSNHYKFTGKERDLETGLDYFGARYYSNGLGRWVTPDWAAKATAVPYAEFADPQSLNLYTYVRNLPTTRVDGDGHDTGVLDKIAQEVIDAVAKPLIESAIPIAKTAVVGVETVVGAVGVVLFSSTPANNDPHERDFGYRMENPQQSQTQHQGQTQETEHQPEPQVSTSGAGATKGGGTIYRVPGSGTKGGKPYIGRHNKPDPAKTRKSKDGRDRAQAEVVDTYNASNTQEGRTKEQQHIDQNGGVQNLDNKRNEIRKDKD